MRAWLTISILAASFALDLDGAAAASSPLAGCEKRKLVAAGLAAKALLGCHGTATERGAAVDPTCIERAGDRLAIKFAKAEAKGPCPLTGDGAASTAALSDAAAALAVALAPPPPAASSCARAKLAAAGRRLQSRLKQEGKHALAPEKEKLAAALAKAGEKFSADWAEAEASGDCVAIGDEASAAAAVDEAGGAVVSEVRGALRVLAGGRLVGSAIRFDALGDPQYRATAARHFNLASTWGETVWGNVEPSQGSFDFGPLDQVLAFTEANDMPLKGICLVWHEYLPAWVSALTDPAEFRDAMENHITTLVGGYAGRIAIWDVVNEAFDGEQLRNTVFLQRLGPDYIADSFHVAHAADPDALLFYNDYGIERLNPKSDLVYEMVVDLLAEGVPIHGIGFQMHIGVTSFWSSADLPSIQQNLERFAALGLRIQLAEAESSLGLIPGNRVEELAGQREVYHDMVALCRAIPSCDVNFFGFTDAYYWITFLNRDPLMFDPHYLAKPAFFGVRDALVGY